MMVLFEQSVGADCYITIGFPSLMVWGYFFIFTAAFVAVFLFMIDECMICL